MQRISEVMSTNPRALGPDDTIRKAAQVMRDDDIGVIPIVDNVSALVGIVTDRDIVITAVADGRDPDDTPIRHSMTAQPDAVAPDTTIEQAATLMQSRQIRRLPVLDNGRLVGMVSFADFAHSDASAEEKAETLEEVSLPGQDLRETRAFPG